MDTALVVEVFTLFLMSFWKRNTCLNERIVEKARKLED
jgi:hypothetical protein